jgi:cadmium resistance transport/sequestration family protein
MSDLVTAIPTGAAAFSATNIDDIVVLTLFFSQVNATFRSRHIFVGQYLGFTALVIASLPGFFGGLILPERWIGLLGLVPIAIGLGGLLNRESDSEEEEAETEKSDPSPIASFLSPQTYGVAAVTVANGSDNIGIYVPLFASSTWESLLGILGVFFMLVGVWCYAAYKLTQQPHITQVLTRYGNALVPFVLIGLGVSIVLESRALNPLVLAAICLGLMGLIRINGREPEVEKN